MSITQFFKYKNDPEDCKDKIKNKLYDCGIGIENLLDESAEKSAGLRKLIEAQDCFLRAATIDRNKEDKS